MDSKGDQANGGTMNKKDKQDCSHPPELRKEGLRRVGDREVRVEECGVCGRVLVHPEDGERALSERGPEDEPVLGPRNVVLTLLGAQPKRPIYNRIVLMKEAFLFEKELAREIDVSVSNLEFVPYKYGPYSRDVDDAIRDLEREGSIRIDRVSAGQKEIIMLTEKGMDEARFILDGFNEEQYERLRSKRKAWDQLGYQGLLEKVYEEYPSYKTKSEIADRIRPRRRWT